MTPPDPPDNSEAAATDHRDALRPEVQPERRCLNEIAMAADVAVILDEASLPVRPEVNGACEILGIDPLYVANEGKLIAIVAPQDAPATLAALRRHPLGEHAATVGTVTNEPKGMVLLDTAFGGSRVVDMLAGDPLPRICGDG